MIALATTLPQCGMDLANAKAVLGCGGVVVALAKSMPVSWHGSCRGKSGMDVALARNVPKKVMPPMPTPWWPMLRIKNVLRA